ncbi:hypothetical protein D3C78_1455660 [compost metagenome]
MSLGRKLALNACSMAGTITSIFSAMPRPRANPPSVPITPTMAPWTMKMAMMLFGLAPSVRRMAMSARLSVTVMTSVDTRLKAATATISVRMMNIMRFSSCTAENQVLFCCVQSRISRWSLSVSASSRATLGASCRSLIFRRMPVGPSRRNSRCASS